MANNIGLHNFCNVVANVLFTSNIVPGTVGLTSPIAANQTQKIRAWIPITVGATGGVRSIVVPPAGGTLLTVTTKLYNTVAPSLSTSSAATVFTNALANAGTHWLEIEAIVINGATAGNVDVQLAQNTSDVLSLTVLRGGSMDVVKLN